MRELILQDRHVTYREIEVTLNISGTSIHSILHEHLAVKKICSHWIGNRSKKRDATISRKKCKKSSKKIIVGQERLYNTLYPIGSNNNEHKQI